MVDALIDWDDEGDPHGNVQHIADKGLTVHEVEEVLQHSGSTDGGEPFQRSSGQIRLDQYGKTYPGRVRG